jgi:hypothetical protein
LHAFAVLLPFKDAIDGLATPRLFAGLKVARQAVLLTIKDPAAALRIARATAAWLAGNRAKWRAALIFPQTTPLVGLVTATSTSKRNFFAAAREFNWKNEGQLLLMACNRAVTEVDRAHHVPCNETVGSSSQLGD